MISTESTPQFYPNPTLLLLLILYNIRNINSKKKLNRILLIQITLTETMKFIKVLCLLTCLITNVLPISASNTYYEQESDSLTIYEGKPYKSNVTASYYSSKLNGRKTASGTVFNNNKLTAAHKKLPFGTKIKVTNVKNKKSVVVTVNDRGPHSKTREIDLTQKAFFDISDKKSHGSIVVSIEVLK